MRITDDSGRNPYSHGRALGIRRIDLSSVQLASSANVREINRDIVLELIRFRQPVARVTLSRLSGLRRSTISAIVEQLIEENWVREGALVRTPRGRPATMLYVNSDKVSFALDLRPDHAILAVVNLSGHFLSRETVMTYSDPAKTVTGIVERMKLLRKQYSDKSFEGIGVSFPGRVHPVTQRLLLAPNLKWNDFDLKGTLEKQSKLRVEIDNDANACLLSELWYGRLNGVRNAVLVAIAEGVGTAILAAGQLYSGHDGLAGEFGHVSVDPNGMVCGCGQRGCWETTGSSRAAMRVYREIAPKSSARQIFQVLRLAQEGDPAAVEAVTRQARALGRGLRLITATLSPELILITGDITAVWEKFGPIVQEEMARSMLAGSAPRLQVSGDGDLARLSGSAAMLMQRHASYHRSTHAPRIERALPSSAQELFSAGQPV